MVGASGGVRRWVERTILAGMSIRPTAGLALALSLNALFSACANTPMPAPRPSTAVATIPNPTTVRLLNTANARLDEGRRLLQGWQEQRELQSLFADAEAAAGRGNHPQAQRLADEVVQRTDLALSGHYHHRAEQQLRTVQAATGLSDAQLERVRIAELALARKQSRRAYDLLVSLNRQLAQDHTRYTVKPGDSLWSIAGHREFYGNSWLWPLIWQANLDVLDRPERLRVGQQLTIRHHPSIDEVVNAIALAHQPRR